MKKNQTSHAGQRGTVAPRGKGRIPRPPRTSPKRARASGKDDEARPGTITKEKLPNYRPGSPDAAKWGCKCAIMDNNYGAGFVMGGKKVFWISADCKLHGMGLEEMK